MDAPPACQGCAYKLAIPEAGAGPAHFGSLAISMVDRGLLLRWPALSCRISGNAGTVPREGRVWDGSYMGT